MKNLSVRPSRLRQSQELRSLVRETTLSAEHVIQPVFFHEGKGALEIPSMPGVFKFDRDLIIKEIQSISKLGIKAVLIFGSSTEKDEQGSAAHNENSPFHQTLKEIKRCSDIILIADVCLCAYTSHGHCGILDAGKHAFDLASTLRGLARTAVSYARCGVDMVAPSAMMDAQVKTIRMALDDEGFDRTGIMSYAVKYASAFYGPFRDIYDSSPSFGDRKNHQMDPANKREAIREATLDVTEGADIVMVKPALCFLDIISEIKKQVQVPVAAYNVSGEYSMIKAAAEKGWLDEKSCVLEMLTSIKRAGADMIISYWAKEMAKWLWTRH